jgi:hypothetical protein
LRGHFYKYAAPLALKQNRHHIARSVWTVDGFRPLFGLAVRGDGSGNKVMLDQIFWRK